MKTTRDGKEIELTPAEMRSAWEETQLEYDRYDLEDVCEVYEFDLSDAEKDEAVQMYRHIRDNYDGWWSYIQEACKTVMRERGQKK